MNRRWIIGALICVLITLGSAHAVMPPYHYQRRIEDSRIKAVAVVESVKAVDAGKRYSTQEVVFRCETALSETVPERFTGRCLSVLHRWQRPGVGGEIYFYPQKGERVFVAVTDDGGAITCYTLMTPELKAALENDPGSVVFGIGDARIVKGEREKQIADAWYLYHIDNQPVGTLHAVVKAPVYRPGTLIFEHRFAIREGGRTVETEIRTRCLDDAGLTPRKMTIRRSGAAPVSVTFVEKAAQEVPDGIFRPVPKSKENRMAIPYGTVSDLLLFEIVKRLSLENETFSYHLLESAELHLKKNRTLRAVGMDPDRPGLYRYTEATDGSASYWVDGNHHLVRVAWDDDKAFVVTDPASAAAAFP